MTTVNEFSYFLNFSDKVLLVVDELLALIGKYFMLFFLNYVFLGPLGTANVHVHCFFAILCECFLVGLFLQFCSIFLRPTTNALLKKLENLEKLLF